MEKFKAIIMLISVIYTFSAVFLLSIPFVNAQSNIIHPDCLNNPWLPQCDPCLNNPWLPQCDPCLNNPWLPQCDPCLNNPWLPQCDPCIRMPWLPQCNYENYYKTPSAMPNTITEGLDKVREAINAGNSTEALTALNITQYGLDGNIKHLKGIIY
jgi:hypothetical protein